MSIDTFIAVMWKSLHATCSPIKLLIWAQKILLTFAFSWARGIKNEQLGRYDF